MEMSRTDCALARESVSADLDGELSELDLHRLHGHLRACADCSAWSKHVKAATTQLREAPFEAPAAVAFELPRSGRTWRVGPAVAVVPAAAFVAVVVISLGGTRHGQPATSTSQGPTARHLQQNGPAVEGHAPASQSWTFYAI